MSLFLFLLCLLNTSSDFAWSADESVSHNLGRIPREEEIHRWNIDVAPDGTGLPAGKGSAKEGAEVYAEHCSGCHGSTGVEGPSPRLAGGQGTLSTSHPLKTIGSYWPYATTMFDYIYRAMPYTAPQSLTPDQTYAVVAWLLFRNGIIEESHVVNAQSLKEIRMPNRNGFVPDSRPDIPSGSVVFPSSKDLGDIEFPTSGTGHAQPYFQHGMLLLHNFEYEDAAEAFQQAQALDPAFAMAYWGEAMTHNHPLWGEQDTEAARRVLKRLGSTAAMRQAMAPTDRERAYLEAVERLYGDGAKPDRDRAYERALGGIAAEYPNDLEAKALYALAILGSSEGTRDAVAYLNAGAIAESVFHENPRHPGAVHYMIHAYDDPKHAIRALPAARIYGSLASAAPHAQHMPSHIFMALGMWPEVVQANELSWASSEERIRRKGLGLENRAYHTLYWLMYGYLQQGRYEKAKGLLEIVESDSRTLGSNHIKDLRASMRATYIVEARAWNVQEIEEDRSVLRFPAAVSDLFAIGLSGVHLNDLSTAQQALALIRECVDQLPNTDPPSSSVMAGRVMVKELEGLIEIVAGRTDQGLSILKEAVILQDAVAYEYGPPFPVKPSHELLGEALLNAGRFQEAEKHFKAALDQAPERALSLRGLSQIPR